MGRTPRYFLPGAPFHITARLQHGESLFSGIEKRIVDIVVRTAAMERTNVVAYAIMPNHMHLLVVQGSRPLSSLMQPLLRRVALLVQRTHRRRGHVFERRYRERVCLDPEYARAIVAYINLNAVRAGLCRDPVSYPWTSHGAYCNRPRGNTPPSLLEAGVSSFLALFADQPGCRATEWRARYRRYVAWRLLADRSIEDGTPCPPAPVCREGDATWRRRFGQIGTDRPTTSQLTPAERASLEDLARSAILETGRHLPLEFLRANRKNPVDVAVRRSVILSALAAGYSGRQIARYLGVTASTVSKVRIAARAAAISAGDL